MHLSSECVLCFIWCSVQHLKRKSFKYLLSKFFFSMQISSWQTLMDPSRKFRRILKNFFAFKVISHRCNHLTVKVNMRYLPIIIIKWFFIVFLTYSNIQLFDLKNAAETVKCQLYLFLVIFVCMFKEFARLWKRFRTEFTIFVSLRLLASVVGRVTVVHLEKMTRWVK